MLHGYAWQVEYPRRASQNFVSTNTEYVRDALLSDMRNLPEWKFRVSLVAFRGETALPINTSVGDLLEMLPPEYQQRLRREDGKLWYDGK